MNYAYFLFFMKINSFFVVFFALRFPAKIKSIQGQQLHDWPNVQLLAACNQEAIALRMSYGVMVPTEFP